MCCTLDYGNSLLFFFVLDHSAPQNLHLSYSFIHEVFVSGKQNRIKALEEISIKTERKKESKKESKKERKKEREKERKIDRKKERKREGGCIDT